MRNYNHYKQFGFEVLKTADSAFLYGTGNLTFQAWRLFKKVLASPPLDWQGKNWKDFYAKDELLLWIKGIDGNRIYIPQSVIIPPAIAFKHFEKFQIILDPEDFQPSDKNPQGLDYYINSNSYNDLIARLKEYDVEKHTLTFQGAQYFDWVMTNLSMDHERPPLPSLREVSSVDGKLRPLHQSNLANITGINCLLFTNDGYMVYQKRNNNVLVRTGELCSGFSGAIDKIDIENVIKFPNPTLANLDLMREGVEEIGLKRDTVKKVIFLGATRELIRGGTPEFFFAIDINLSKEEVSNLVPRDKEGTIKFVHFGMYARAQKDNNIESFDQLTLWKLMEKIEKETKAPISIPFLTNLALWYWLWSNGMVGVGPFE